MKLLSEINCENIYPISIGAAVLGTGGGGDPKIGYLMAKQALETYGSVKLVNLDDIEDDSTVAALSMMGAPSVALEKIPNGGEFELLFNKIEEHFKTKVDYLYPVEAGGINSMIPIIGAAQKQIPLIDADTMGRAFPELQMVTLALFKIKAFPIFLANDLMETQLIDANSYEELEIKARDWTIQNGGQAAVGDGVISGKDFKRAGVKDVVSLSYQLGNIILSKDNVLSKLNNLGVQTLCHAKIVDVDRKTEGGFNRGYVKLKGIDEYVDHTFDLYLQNENTAIFENGDLLCSVPDLIILLDNQTFMPITTDSYKYGQRVIVCTMKCDPKWITKDGLDLVGPQAFGYEFSYKNTLTSKGEYNV